MPLVSASNEIQASYCALMFLGVPLNIAGLRPVIFQIVYFKKGNLYYKYALGKCFKRNMQCEIFNGPNNLPLSSKSS